MSVHNSHGSQQQQSGGSTRSTRGASKQRRDQINIEIQKLRDLLPLNGSIKDRLFQLQVMSLGCIFIRKQRYFQYIIQTCEKPIFVPNTYKTAPKQYDGCKALRGFLLMVTRDGKMLYISENASEYLGYSVEEIMCQGDSVYDLVDTRDHPAVQAELLSGPPMISAGAFPDERVFICRMNLSRTAKRHIQYYKFVLVEGRYLHPAEYYQAVNAISTPSTSIQPIFAAFCQPLINPENAESLATGNTLMFRSVHSMDMNGCHYLDYKGADLEGTSWYQLLHPNHLPQVSYKHRMLCQQKEGSMINLIRLQNRKGEWVWLHAVFVVKGNFIQQNQEMKKPRHLIHVTYQILSELEAMTLQANEWIYNIKHHHFPREMSAKENDFNGSNYEPESPGSDLTETPVPIIPNTQICVEIPKKKTQVRSSHSLMTPEHSSPDSSSSLSTAPKSLCLDTLPQFYGPESDVPLPELGDDLDEFFRQVEYSSPFDEHTPEVEAKDLFPILPNDHHTIFKNPEMQRPVKCEVPWWETESNFDLINRSLYANCGIPNNIPHDYSQNQMSNTGRIQRHGSLQYNESHIGWTNFLDPTRNEMPGFLHPRNQKRLGSWAGVDTG